MTKQEILEYFKDINHAYNESTRLDDLYHMLDELMQSNSDEDCINRQAAIRIAEQGQIQGYEWQFKELIKLPSVKPQEPKTDMLDKIRAEIDEQYDRVHPYNISCAEGLEMALEIIDKYKAESEDKE